MLHSSELKHVLSQIDEQLALRTVADADRKRLAHLTGLPAAPDPVLVDMLLPMLGVLRDMRAPLYIADGKGPRSWLKRLANLPIRLVSSKQRVFNERLGDLLEQAIRAIIALNASAEHHRQLVEVVAQQQESIRFLHATVESLTAEVARLRAEAASPPET